MTRLANEPDYPGLSEWIPMLDVGVVFTPEECEKILDFPVKEQQMASIQGEDRWEVNKYRVGHVGWIEPSDTTSWAFIRVFNAVKALNSRHYRLHLEFMEPFQLAEYSEDSFYEWHLDIGPDGFSYRKMSTIVQLSHPSSYDGGDVELMYSMKKEKISKERGFLTVFPSYIMHRVVPITRGKRISLVGWICGKPYS